MTPDADNSRPIVVTGAYGQLGGELCRQLGDAARPLDIDQLDLTDGPVVLKTLREIRPRLVINCAAYTQVDQAELAPDACRAVNATAVEHLARACGELDCPLVQISTDYVFGEGPQASSLKPQASSLKPRPWREDDPPAPQGVYARTKLEGERIAARHPKHLIVRTCGLYARPSDPRARNFVKTMLRLAASGQEVRVVDDQNCTPSYVPHVARAVLFLAGLGGLSQFSGRHRAAEHYLKHDRPENGTVPFGTTPWSIYHVTNRGATTWYDFAAEVFRLAGAQVPLRRITTAEYAARAPRPAYSVLDTTAYHRLGGPAMPDWREALGEYFAEAGTSSRFGSHRSTAL